VARLGLSEAELRQATTDVGRLLDYLAQVQAVDLGGTGDLPPAGADDPAPLRADVPRPSLPLEAATAGTVATEAGMFSVPKVLDPASPREDP